MKIYLAIIISLSILLMTGCEPEKAKAPQGILELNSIPQGANVILNSNISQKNQTPSEIRLRPGTYLIKMSKKNYQPAWKYVKIRANKTKKMTMTLRPVRGSVLITSNPVGAKITMNGKRQGLTPLVLTNLKLGEYSAQIEHVNRAPRIVKWMLTDIRPQKVSASLESDIGTFVLKTIPPKARVYINGKARGFSPFRTELQEGMHKIKITLAGFSEVKTTVDIVRDKQTAKTFTLLRLPGSLEFRSTPKGALVYIDDRTFGKTPLIVSDLEAKTKAYKIRVEKNGFDSISRDAYVSAGRENIIEFTLKRNTGGIDLIVNPPGVSVYVNGKEHGLTVEGASKDLSKVIHIRNLPAGKYQIMLAHKRMRPATMKKYIVVRKAKITRPKPINVWIGNYILKLKNEPQKLILLLAKHKDNIIYSPEPRVKILIPKKEMYKIEVLRPLTEEDM
ncbi:MAG: PEGA domain-containing protein [Victivallales bacterium]|nr:PEGA domain-containing protein [Victivallales bacterium]